MSSFAPSDRFLSESRQISSRHLRLTAETATDKLRASQSPVSNQRRVGTDQRALILSPTHCPQAVGPRPWLWAAAARPAPRRLAVWRHLRQPLLRSRTSLH